MKDQPSTSDDDDDDEEPVRFSRPQPSMDEYLEYDPETDSYYAPGEPSDWNPEAWSREFEKTCKEVRGGGLISRDDLLAAGALDVPAAWRKSLGVMHDDQPDLFSGLLDEDDSLPENHEPTPGDQDGDASAEDCA